MPQACIQYRCRNDNGIESHRNKDAVPENRLRKQKQSSKGVTHATLKSHLRSAPDLAPEVRKHARRLVSDNVPEPEDAAWNVSAIRIASVNTSLFRPDRAFIAYG